MDLGNGRGHLAYSTLVHAGDTWAEMRDSVRTHLPAVKAAVSPDQPFGVSLRLSAASAATLAEDEGERRRFREFLDAEGLYVYTVNAFPYGPFKGRQVKEQVYEPDWSTEDRTAYTMRVADVLVDISPEGVIPSIQTAPLAFRPKVVDDAYLAACTRNVLRVVAHLATIERETGRRIKLAIEPEPYCYLETTDETVAYFSEQLYSAAGVHQLSELAGLPVSEATGVLRRHLGVVFDICHQAVGFEDIPSSLAKLVAAGIPIFKLQEAAALWVPRVDADVVAALACLHRHDLPEPDHGAAATAQTTRYLNLGTLSTPGTPTRATAELGRIFTSRCSWTRSAPSVRRGSRWSRRWPSTGRHRCRTTSRSRRTRGTCCPRTSRPATSTSTSGASWSSCAVRSSESRPERQARLVLGWPTVRTAQ